MSENIPISAELPAEDRLHELNERQKYIADSLKSWYLTAGADSVVGQRARANLFHALDRELVELLKDVYLMNEGLEMTLTTGLEAVATSRLYKVAYGMLMRRYGEIEPSSEISITQTRHWVLHDYDQDLPQPREFYGSNLLFVGNSRHYLPLTALASTINLGGQLEIRPRATKAES